MHELSVATALVEQAEESAKNAGAARVLSVSVVVGKLSGVQPEALDFAFSVASEGTFLENSRLIIEAPPLKVKCVNCGAETFPSYPELSCVSCGSADTKIVQGREFVFKSMEIE